jgi:hypothetical protein
MSAPQLSKIVCLKPEPQTTAKLAEMIQCRCAQATVADYRITATLREHFKRVFECVVHRKGQGFWVQAEYGAGKTHFLGALLDLLLWPQEKVWDALRDDELRKDYAAPLAKTKLFPVAFSLRGMGQAEGEDSLMRVFEEQVRESLLAFAPELSGQVQITSAELAAHWYAGEATEDEKAGVASFFQREHQRAPEEFRAKQGVKKFGQELVRSRLPAGRLRGKFKERFAFLYDQITQLGGYDGLLFVADEFRSWQDRHPAGTAAYAEDEEILETLAFVLPSEGRNVLTLIASQGDMPQKLSGGGHGDRFIPLYLLADKNKNDFGEIVVFRCRDLVPGAKDDVKEYYDHCRKEYRFIRQGNVSLQYFSDIFPFQPRCFEVIRRITQNAEAHNLPTARSAIRMAWQTLSDPRLLGGTRLVTLADLVRSEELQKGLNHEHYRDSYRNLCGTLEHLPSLELAAEESEQARRILETLYLWSVSLPDNFRDGLTASEVAEAAWLADDAVGSTAQAEHLLACLVQAGFPLRAEKKTREGKEVEVFSYEVSATQTQPVKIFAPLKKKAKEEQERQNAKWLESLFWQLPDVTEEAQRELNVNGGLFDAFAPADQRSHADRKDGKPPAYAFPHRTGASTKRVHRVAYGGEVVFSDRWREEFGKEIENPDLHFRLVYLTSRPVADDAKITADLRDARVAVCRPEALSEETREVLADLVAAEQMRRNCAAPNQGELRDYAEGKRREAVKKLLKCQLDEYRRGKVLTQKGYAIQAVEIFKSAKGREEDLAGRLLEKAYGTPLFSAKDFKKDFTDADAKKVFAGLFHKEPAKAEKDAAQNFAVGLELAVKAQPGEFQPAASQALAQFRTQLQGQADVPLSDLKTRLCCPPYGLTEPMVALYVFSLIKCGGYELALKPGSGYALSNGKPIPRDRVTAHLLPLCDWNAKLDKALYGARLVRSTQKGWNEVLPFARVLDPEFKPAGNPDEEQARNDALLSLLAKLKAEIPEVEKSITDLAAVLGGVVPVSLKETFTRMNNLAATESYQAFDAVVRESYPDDAAFAERFASYDRARKLRDRAFGLSQMVEYLGRASVLDAGTDLDRKGLVAQLKFESLLNDPSILAAREEQFERWKEKYQHAYRKAHRAHYEQLQALAGQVEPLRPRVRALLRMNQISELGPAPAATVGVESDLQALDGAVWLCPDAAEPKLGPTDVACPKCAWGPDKKPPADLLDRLTRSVAQGLEDRFLRFKDATIAAVLKKASGSGDHGISDLLEIIQLADADRLAAVLTDDLVSFLRQLLYDENRVDEQIGVASILRQVGAIEDGRAEESLALLTSLLRKAIKDAKAKHGAGKRVRVFLCPDHDAAAGRKEATHEPE